MAINSISDPIKPIDHQKPNQLTQSILLKRRLWNAAKSKSSYTDSRRFKKALADVYARADWMVKQGYGFYGKDAYLSEVIADAWQRGV
jgi:hypothetical protein